MVGFAQTDDMNLAVSGREDHGIKAMPNVSKHTIPGFAVVLAVIRLDDSARPVQFGHESKRQAPFTLVAITFVGVKSDEICIYCTHKKYDVKRCDSFESNGANKWCDRVVALWCHSGS